jgi:hypothetical protein
MRMEHKVKGVGEFSLVLHIISFYVSTEEKSPSIDALCTSLAFTGLEACECGDNPGKNGLTCKSRDMETLLCAPWHRCTCASEKWLFDARTS